MTAWPAKDPDETLDYGINWATRLDAGDTITGSTYTFVQASGCTLGAASFTTTTTKVFVSGGTAGLIAILNNRVTTAGGRTLDWQVSLPIVAVVTDYTVNTGADSEGPGPVVLEIPTGPKKRKILEMAREECGLAGWEFEATPEEVLADLRRLNTMMLEWPWNAMGYQGDDFTEGNPEDLSGLSPNVVSAVVSELAFRIAPTIGKTLSAEQRASRANLRRAAMASVATLPIVQFPAKTQRGRGNQYWSASPFLPDPQE